ncbi:mitochondrial fission ELM1 family protein [Martelella soudanensis]|uniref:mitochondrial fission ELM1 family protein n=1 Tax=unclassified Martelella TaxID=2629616 RepID=UPI0015DE19DF|nr:MULTISPECIES: mitochondrial fission ELM1 family protein [unclassified Martelella]
MHIWILTDGKIGDRMQCLGVVSRLGAEAEEKVIAPGKPWEWLMPRGPVPPKHRPGRPGSPIAPPFPDVAIASGRRMVPYLKAVKAASGGRTFTVFLKDPRIGESAADLIWMPSHDRFRAENVLVTDTGPHPLTPAAIAEAAAVRPAEWDRLPSPRLGVLIGNPVSGARDRAAALDHFMKQIDHAKNEIGSIIVTQSRRTPEPVMAALRDRLEGFPHWIWSPETDNPYRAMLGFADMLAVTADSHNMMSEALSTGTPVFPLRPYRLNPKLAGFIDRLDAAGQTRPFEGALEPYDYVPVDATEEIAEAIRQGFAKRSH